MPFIRLKIEVMHKFIALPEQEKKIAFQKVASAQGILPSIVEKDFWVCWVLRQIFDDAQLAKQITFKGGTSLSKAYQLIERFSEDIDLTISKDAPYLTEGKNPMETGISGKERARRIKTLKENAQRYVAELALPTLERIFVGKLSHAGDWKLALDTSDPDRQTILFHYPKIFNYQQGLNFSNWTLGKSNFAVTEYIKPAVKLEFGARGDIEPSENKRITSYMAEAFPEIFDIPHSNVHVLAAKRTFWEKVTILHALYHGTKMRDRMSRHYYDTFVMAQKGIADAALQDTALLEKVVRNKSLLFEDNKASYETAIIGSLRLVPPSNIKADLAQDYAAMSEMFLRQSPSFESIMDSLSTLEQKINGTI